MLSRLSNNQNIVIDQITLKPKSSTFELFFPVRSPINNYPCLLALSLQPKPQTPSSPGPTLSDLLRQVFVFLQSEKENCLEKKKSKTLFFHFVFINLPRSMPSKLKTLTYDSDYVATSSHSYGLSYGIGYFCQLPSLKNRKRNQPHLAISSG